jgi:hypothetical protein
MGWLAVLSGRPKEAPRGRRQGEERPGAAPGVNVVLATEAGGRGQDRERMLQTANVIEPLPHGGAECGGGIRGPPGAGDGVSRWRGLVWAGPRQVWCGAGLLRGRPQADWPRRLPGGTSAAADAAGAGDVRLFFGFSLTPLLGVWYNGDSPIVVGGRRARREGALELSSRHKMLLTLVLRMGLS